MPHVTNRREASESSRPNVRNGKYRILSALSEIKFLFCENLSTRASESANTGVVPSEISESGIKVLCRGILIFFIISFYRTCRSYRVTVSFSETVCRFLKLLGAGHMADNDQGLPHPRPPDIRTRVRAANAARREVCRACLTACECESHTQVDGTEVLGKRKGIFARKCLKEAWNKPVTR